MKSKAKPNTGTPKKERTQIKGADVTETAKVQRRDLLRKALPSVEVLASIAAVVAKGTHAEPGLAVDCAFRLWKSARARLREEIQEAADDAMYEKLQAESWDKIAQLREYPGTFAQFLKLVVKAKTPADSTKRFREYLRDSLSEDEAVRRIGELKRVGFRDWTAWLYEAECYLHWWAGQRSELARAAAKKRKSKKTY